MQEQRTLAAPSLRALLASIVDYAGLFPPAALPLGDAVRNYARYRQGSHAWMLGRFVLPAARLEALADYDVLFRREPPFRFSVLGTGGADDEAFQDALAADLQRIAAFHARHPGRVRTEALEVRLPEALSDPEALLRRAAEQIDGSSLPGLDVFYEIPLDARTQTSMPPFLEAAAAANHAHRGEVPSLAGVKVRCGGETAEAVPTAEHLAFFLTRTRAAGVRFKATAGLHHPVRHDDPDLGTEQHGFVNLFGAAALGIAHDFGEKEIRRVLLEKDPAAFRFTEAAFYWRDHDAPLPAIRRARSEQAFSFGSCSFEEPLADLQMLGLLEP